MLPVLLKRRRVTVRRGERSRKSHPLDQRRQPDMIFRSGFDTAFHREQTESMFTFLVRENERASARAIHNTLLLLPATRKNVKTRTDRPDFPGEN